MISYARLLDRFSPVVLALLLALSASLCGAAMNAIVKSLSATVHPFEVSFLRAVFGVLLFAPWIARQGSGLLRSPRLGLLGLRGALHGASMLLLYWAVSLAPLAKVAALRFSAPLWATLLAVLVLHETIRARRMVALAAGVVGALLILRPGVVALDLGAAVALGSAAAWGTTMIVIKILSKTESAATITLFGIMGMVPVSGVIATFVWTTPSMGVLAWSFGLACLGNLANLMLVGAFKRADVTVLTPVQFTLLIWSSAIGYVWFDEVPALWTWIGGTMIFAAAAYVAVRERKLQPDATAPRSTEAQ